jgi:ectoine hydroxylase-related dioxygenase (phytanoyl-CoA dioxygenase family)
MTEEEKDMTEEEKEWLERGYMQARIEFFREEARLKREEFKRPFPALTPAQRLHLEVYGYVIIENALSKARVERLLDKAYEIERIYRQTGKHPYGIKQNHSSRISEDFFRIDNIVHVDECFFDYVTDPYLVGMAEEIIGTNVVLSQSDVHIHRYPAEEIDEQIYRFHGGWYGGASYTVNGLYHCPYVVKTLTNLTDLGPEDGGTAVIPGSHKLSGVAMEDVIQTAMEEPEKLIHTVVAPAGSTLLFYESLIHSAGVCTSGKERILIIAGYWSARFQADATYETDPEFLKTVPDKYLPLLTGSRRTRTDTLTRELKTPAEKYPVK